MVFDDMIANVLINKKFQPQPIVSKLFIRDRTLRISINLIWESYFSLPKNIRLNSKHYFIMKIPKSSSNLHFFFSFFWFFDMLLLQIN